MVNQFGSMQKGFVVLNRDDNVIEAGENGQVNFFVKKDGSTSIGTGLRWVACGGGWQASQLA